MSLLGPCQALTEVTRLSQRVVTVSSAAFSWRRTSALPGINVYISYHDTSFIQFTYTMTPSCLRRLAWQQETFEQLYVRQQRRLGQLGNLCLMVGHLLWLCTQSAEPGRSRAATWAPAAAMLLLDALSFLPGFVGRFEARANGAVRICR